MKWSLLIVLFYCFATNAQVRDTMCVNLIINTVYSTSKIQAENYKISIVSPTGFFKEVLIQKAEDYEICLPSGKYEITAFKDRFYSPRKTIEIGVDSIVGCTLELRPMEIHCRFFFGVYFETKECVLSNASKDTISLLVKTMKDNPNIVIELIASSDSKGNAHRNMRLSQCYGNLVKDYLVLNGIESGRIEIKAYGETELINKCKDGVRCTKEEHAMNRYVNFRVIRNDWPNNSKNN
ncbi:MAG: OmpA family protein [Sphingobacteriales bacterium JAD_PAG50586_3]|nr:MAG: OmpA family protein [Sphingobacteriales bacterium JAD_PAG50586_3]